MIIVSTRHSNSLSSVPFDKTYVEEDKEEEAEAAKDFYSKCQSYLLTQTFSIIENISGNSSSSYRAALEVIFNVVKQTVQTWKSAQQVFTRERQRLPCCKFLLVCIETLVSKRLPKLTWPTSCFVFYDSGSCSMLYRVVRKLFYKKRRCSRNFLGLDDTSGLRRPPFRTEQTTSFHLLLPVSCSLLAKWNSSRIGALPTSRY